MKYICSTDRKQTCLFEEKILGEEQEQTGDCRVTRTLFIKITGSNTRPTHSSLAMQCEKRGPQIITLHNSCLIYPAAILSRATKNEMLIKAGIQRSPKIE